MRRTSILAAIALAILFTGGPGAAPARGADEHAATSADIQAALRDHPTPIERQRETVSTFLDRPEVREVAETHGIDLSSLEGTVATMNAEALGPVLEQISRYEAQAGGDSIVISSTTVIIILLVVILVAVA